VAGMRIKAREARVGDPGASFHVQRVNAGEVREARVGDPAAEAHVKRADAGEVRETRVGDPGAKPHVQRVDAGEVREARVGDPGALAHVQRVDAGEVREANDGDPGAPRSCPGRALYNWAPPTSWSGKWRNAGQLHQTSPQGNGSSREKGSPRARAAVMVIKEHPRKFSALMPTRCARPASVIPRHSLMHSV
jgi:hypothetical protein